MKNTLILFLCCATALAVASHAQTVSFSAPVTTINTSYQFFNLQLADVNRDGRLDLIATDRVKLCTYLGNGDGSLQAGVCNNLSGRAPDIFGVGDFNGDGIPDVAVAIARTNKIQILLGVGDGTFTMGQFIALPIEQVLGITIADVTGNGSLDLIASYPYLSNSKPGQYGIVIVGGVGNGTFGKPYDIALGAYSTAVGDFNGDGIADIVGSPRVELVGKGGGAFSYAPVSFDAIAAPIFVADLNHDAKLDVLALNNTAIAASLGNGDGTFQSFRRCREVRLPR